MKECEARAGSAISPGGYTSKKQEVGAYSSLLTRYGAAAHASCLNPAPFAMPSRIQ